MYVLGCVKSYGVKIIEKKCVYFLEGCFFG